jgi:hypothetical protein
MRTLDTLAAGYPPEIRSLALQAREFILDHVPGAEENVDARGPYVSYGYGPGYRGIVCYLTLSKKGVKLGLAEGAALPDPRGLLEGEGKAHRHVPLATPSDLRKPGLKPLVRACVAAWRKRNALAGV